MTSTQDVTLPNGPAVRVGRALGLGETCNLYECVIGSRRSGRPGVFKIARDALGERVIDNAAARLGVLHAVEPLRPFIPECVATLNYRVDGDTASRRAAVLAYHPAVRSPGDLYSLEEVLQHYRDGVDARDMAWVWRRLLTALIHVHAAGIVHAAVTPAHVLIGPADHAVVLIGWGTAVPSATAVGPRSGPYADWFGAGGIATPSTDVAAAARTMLALLGQHLPTPTPLEPALRRYFDRCLAAGHDVDAPRLLADFDKLIDTLWGPRQFRPFAMPARNVAL